MDENGVIKTIYQAKSWFINHQNLLIQYAINIVFALVILLAGLIIAKWISRITNRLMSLRDIDKTIRDFLSAIVRYGIIAFTLIAVLSKLGVQTASVIAVLGAAGLAIGLALQGSLSNFAAGVLLVIFRPLRSGEYVILGSVEGTVEHIQIFSTSLRTADDRIIVIPNSKVINANIINTSREPNRRTQIMVSVAYNSDIDRVKKVLGDVITADERIQHDKGFTIRLHEITPFSLNFVVRVWTTNLDAWNVYWDLMENFKKQLDAHNISIPFPQIDVHLYQNQNS
ncbi:Small-conductance mechanosensitive channel [Arsenophonus endosymbiont of Aleurodicus dispersus]|uniref:small-conductance mechanosensitive channel MscS n=1 Tax=Arsenophonus endosymbiont of Aleurodicus dispersus TaxID=235559 RepID=UPI000EB1277D|nr:small-conductance mechanosensitive channel MscS [Arsenophonus endosymbiont of Aleurodicus dispersus]VAY02344.1 Small-conductance mechanosensitive channel [Arsenophonus endosymbiont of Aleurodicus dispersus]